MAKDSSPRKSNTFKSFCAAILLRGIMRLLGATYRVKFIEGEGRVQELLDREDPVILCAWHNRMFYMGIFVESALSRKGFNLTQMVSQSRDGEIGYRVGKWAKIHVIRGSSNRGGSKALRSLFRVIQKEKSSIVILPDGSQGPVYKAKAGAIVLAQLSRAPIYLFSYSADRAWRAKSWDQLIVPKPFAKITVRIPEPIKVPRELNKEQLEEQRQRLEDELNRMRESES
ncbi:MAG: lysophospholipid acyltransferase family protein [Verrucomicrobia bacterium]|nr:lysophospholipid acyltransferase family protein [Verrucomicrobiota bacterium]